MSEVRNIDTRERILDAAERLFMTHGFDGASMRQITGEAAVNLAAVNYHFGSKEALMQEVFRRRLDWLNDERIRVLDEMEEAAGDKPLKPSQIVNGFFGTLAAPGRGQAAWRYRLSAPARAHADRSVGLHPHLSGRRVRRRHGPLQAGAIQFPARRATGGNRLALPLHARRHGLRHCRYRRPASGCRLGNRGRSIRSTASTAWFRV